ncbi:MAG: hypothetical protein ACXABY_02185 [Candidatus Thorarchaeota archaeon]|jgi:hypothetical protein
MSTATDLGLSGPVQFLGAYVINVGSQLGLAQSPSTCNVTLVEDECATPPKLFIPPDLGTYVELRVGANFAFCGVVTKYEQDISNISGRTIKVDIADAREIMKSIPIILAPGYRGVVDTILQTECSVIDAFGAFDVDGINHSDWNTSGMTYGDIILSLTGGAKTSFGTLVTIPQQAGKAFGQDYVFDLSEITPLILAEQRVNTNLISMADFVQELATSNSFDWYIESSIRADGYILVKIKPIDRTFDNTDIDLDNFLAANSGFVVSAKRGFELRNEIACSVLLGAPVESLRARTVTGMANNPVDLSEEGGSARYYMTEDEMRIVLGNKAAWEFFVKNNGDMARYGITDFEIAPLYTIDTEIDKNQTGKNAERKVKDTEIREKRAGQVYQKLKGHAEASYGKRFLFSSIVDSDYVDAVWTVDVVAGNANANEYFRNEQGKTRCYVEFVPTTDITSQPAGPVGFVVGKGADAAQPLDLQLQNSFTLDDSNTEADKANYIKQGGSLFVAATIEEGNIVKLDTAVTVGKINIYDYEETIKALADQSTEVTADGNLTTKAQRAAKRRDQLNGAYNALIEQHAQAYQPKVAYIPTRDRFLRYGPVFSQKVGPTAEGKLEIIQDDGFSPWEFGGFQLMIDSMQFKVDNQASDVKTVETADVTIEGFPKLSIGDSLGFNSNINGISIAFGGQVQTTYTLTSFARQFGELSKDELAALSLYARRGGSRTFPQDSVGFIERYRTRIARQFGGIGASSSAGNTGGATSFE